MAIPLADVSRIGLLSLFVAVFNGKAELEYTGQVPLSLVSEYQYLIKNKAPTLDGKLVSPEVPVRFKRKQLSGRTGLYFEVDTEWISEKVGKTESVSSPNKDSSTIKRKRDKDVNCNGLPRMEVYLRNYERPWYKTFRNRGNTSQVFCFTDMHIDIIRMRNKEPYMRLTLKFSNPKGKHIGIVMHPFKASKNQAVNNQARRTRSPISLEEFSKPSLKPKINVDDQYFTGDISWVKGILRSAKLQRSGKCGPLRKYAEYYLAGPVIIEREAYNKILSLEKNFEKYASGEKIE